MRSSSRSSIFGSQRLILRLRVCKRVAALPGFDVSRDATHGRAIGKLACWFVQDRRTVTEPEFSALLAKLDELGLSLRVGADSSEVGAAG